MATSISALYKVIGEEGPALRRVQKAMQWLLSPKAEGIGEELLRDAHALHGKPLTIAATTIEQTSYSNLEGAHIIHVNPDHVAGLRIKAADGTVHAMSVEQALGHELKHAGQVEVNEGLEVALLNMHQRAEARAASELTTEQLASQQASIQNAMAAPDYATARKHLYDYIDNVGTELNRKATAYIHQDPEFIDYVRNIEMPAMEVENKIAVLKGIPPRTDYLHGYDVEPAVVREAMADELVKLLDLRSKPDIAPPARSDGASWAKSLGPRTGAARSTPS